MAYTKIQNQQLKKNIIFFMVIALMIVISIYFTTVFLLRSSIENSVEQSLIMDQYFVQYQTAYHYLSCMLYPILLSGIPSISANQYLSSNDLSKQIAQFNKQLSVIREFKSKIFEVYLESNSLSSDQKDKFYQFFTKQVCDNEDLANEYVCQVPSVSNLFDYGLQGAISKEIQSITEVLQIVNNPETITDQQIASLSNVSSLMGQVFFEKILQYSTTQINTYLLDLNDSRISSLILKLMIMFVVGGLITTFILIIISPLAFCSIFEPRDNFQDINYEEDMGICIGTNGNETNMTEYQKFEAFIQHDCHPLIVLEGVEGSKLQLKIRDCDALSDDILNNCNIMTEKNKHSEFQVWISLFDTAGVIGGGACLGALFGGNSEILSSYYNKSPPYIIPDVAGVEITWYGSTPETMNESQCGVNAGEDLASKDVPSRAVMDFQSLYDYVLGMGYQAGLTLLPIPYDWRRMAGNHEVTTNLMRTIEYAVALTGKKVVIAGHSFGCLAFQMMMNAFPQEFKDLNIESFVGMACAWGGSTAGFGEFITGEKLGWWKIGYNLNDQRPIINSITAYFDLMPKEIFSKETQWGKEINERALKEANWNSSYQNINTSFGWFPTPDKECYSSRSEDKECGFHLFNLFTNPFAYTASNSYMVNQTSVIALLDEYILRTQAELDFQKKIEEGKVSEEEEQQIWGNKKLIPKDRVSLMMGMSQRNGVQRLINPGVKIHHIYGGNLRTNTWYNITGDPRKSTNEGKFPSEDEFRMLTHWGDETVNIDNAIVPSLKWAWDFENSIANAKPVHMIDYCSNYSQLMFKDSTGKYSANFSEITENTYNGILCNNYSHSEFPDDEFIDKYIATLLKSGKAQQPFALLKEADVNTILSTCPHLMAPWQSQSFAELLDYGTNQQNLEQNKKNYSYPFSQPNQEFLEFLAQFYKNLDSQEEKILKQ